MPSFAFTRSEEVDGSLITTNYIDGFPVAQYRKPPPARIRRERTFDHLPRDSSKLAGPKETLAWANHLYQNLFNKVRETDTPEWLSLFAEHDTQSGDVVHKIRLGNMPYEIGHMFADAAHAIRSGFDQLIVALVEANGKAVTKGNRFPMWTPGEFKQSVFNADVRGTSEVAQRVIKRTLQVPNYQARVFHLHALDISYKHHRPVVVAAGTTSVQTKTGIPNVFVSPKGEICIGGGGVPFMVNAGEPLREQIFPLVDGSVIHVSPAGFKEEVELTCAFSIGPAHPAAGTDIIRASYQWLKDLEYLILRCERVAI